MQKEWITRVSLVVGLLAAIAWCLVFVMLVVRHHQPSKHVHWDRVAIGAVVSFVVGWGAVRFATRTPPDPRKDSDDFDF